MADSLKRTTSVSGLALLASAPLGCSLRATHGDYDAYRSYRLADDQSARALAGATYLERYPEGVYAEEVRAALGAEEEQRSKRKDSSCRRAE